MNARAELAAACAARDRRVFALWPGQETPLVRKRHGGSGVHDALESSVVLGSWTEPVGEPAP